MGGLGWIKLGQGRNLWLRAQEVDVLGSIPNKPTVSVDVKQHFNNNLWQWVRHAWLYLLRPTPAFHRATVVSFGLWHPKHQPLCTQKWPSPSLPPPPNNTHTHTHTHTHNLPNKKNSLCFVAGESQVRHWPWGSRRMFAGWHLSHLPCNGCWPVSRIIKHQLYTDLINCKYDWRTSPLVSFQFVPLLMQNWSQPFCEVLQTLPGTCSVS